MKDEGNGPHPDHDHDHEYMVPDMVPALSPGTMYPWSRARGEGQTRRMTSILDHTVLDHEEGVYPK